MSKLKGYTMNVIGYKILTGYKTDGNHTIFWLNIYVEIEPNVRKRQDKIEAKIIKLFSNKKHYDRYTCEIVDCEILEIKEW